MKCIHTTLTGPPVGSETRRQPGPPRHSAKVHGRARLPSAEFFRATARPAGIRNDAVPAIGSGPRRAWLIIITADVIGLGWPAALRTSGRLPLVALVVLALLFLQSGGLYRPRLHLSVMDETTALATRTIAAALLVGGAVGILGLRPSVNEFARFATVVVASQLLARSMAYRVVRWARAHGHVTHTALIIGGGVVSAQIAQTLEENASYGLHPIGFLDGKQRDRHAERIVPHLGPVECLKDILAETHVTVLVVGFGGDAESSLVDVLRASERAGCELFVVPRLFEIMRTGNLQDHIGAIPVVRIRRPRLTGISWKVKRLIDVVVATSALVVLSPLMAMTALAVRLEGGPGVLFRQVRVGLDGHEFELLKFRSMKPADAADSATTWNIAADDRVGAVGRVMRRTSLDELPQLWNILRGEMTLVGPRPERPHFVERFVMEYPRYHHRHRVPSGLTGLAQVSGLRGDTSIADRARFDNFYIENWSLWLDVKIVVGTLREVIFARGR